MAKLRRRESALRPQERPHERALEAALESAVMAHPDAAQLANLAGDFALWAGHAGVAQLKPGEAAQALEAQRARLEEEKQRAARRARIFTPAGALRPARYRHGAEFCPACARHKDYRKECPHCGHLELTL